VSEWEEALEHVGRAFQAENALASLREFMREHGKCSDTSVWFGMKGLYCDDSRHSVRAEWTLPAKEGT
jgi:hypothetical protein